VSSTLAGTFTVDEGEGDVVTVGSSAAFSLSPPQDARTSAAATVRTAVRVVRGLERFTRTS
jgi:hypothetical protein